MAEIGADLETYSSHHLQQLAAAVVIGALRAIAKREPEPGPELWLRSSRLAGMTLAHLGIFQDDLEPILKRARAGELVFSRWQRREPLDYES